MYADLPSTPSARMVLFVSAVSARLPRGHSLEGVDDMLGESVVRPHLTLPKLEIVLCPLAQVRWKPTPDSHSLGCRAS